MILKNAYLITIIFCLFISVISLTGCKKCTGRIDEKSEKTVKKELAISTNPKDGQEIFSLEQPLYVYLSHKVETDKFSFAITPDPGGWKTAWRKRGKHVILQHKNPFEQGVEYELQLQVESENLKKIIHFTAYGPSSIALIKEDEKNGVLDMDTAWTYRLQALYEPDLLPSKYKSATPLKCGSMYMEDFWNMQNDLKSSTIKKLKPYLVRPTHPDSFASKRMIKELSTNDTWSFSTISKAFARVMRPTEEHPRWKWFTIESAVYPIKVWSPKSKQDAKAVLNEIEGYAMYYSFKDLLEREPLSDVNDKPDNGGDEKLDIYLLPIKTPGVLGASVKSFPSRKKTPGWIGVLKGLSGVALRSTLAHEIFHVFQWAIDAKEEHWWNESTATWAEDYIDHDMDTEQQYLHRVFFEPLHRQETLTMVDGQHEYGIYLYPYYLGSKFGDKKISEVWKACENSDALDALNSTLPKGFDESFKEFSLINYDINPHEGEYVDAKGPLEIYEYHGEEEDEVVSDEVIKRVKAHLQPLSAKYFSIENEADPELTPHIRFNLKDFYMNNKLTVQAIIEPEGRAQEEDWSDREGRSFCINDEADDFKNIGLVIASAERKSIVFSNLYIEANAERCFEGETTATITRRIVETFKDDDSIPSGGKTETYERRREIEVTINAVFEHDRSVYHYWESPPEIVEYYNLKSWNIESSKATYKQNDYYEVRDVGEIIHHKGLVQKRIRIIEMQGRAVKKDEENDPTAQMMIVLDAETGKAKEVDSPGLSAEAELHGKWEEEVTYGDDNWDTKDGRYHGSRSYKYDGESESHSSISLDTVTGPDLECMKVKSGDGIRQLSGSSKESESKYEGQKVEYSCNWQVKRSKKKEKK